MNRTDIIAEARNWIGVPFIEQHRTKHGCDCAGLLIGIARSLGVGPKDEEIPPYRQVADGTMLGICDRFMQRIKPSDAKPGDAVAIIYDRQAQHLGILADYKWGGHSIIHAAANVRPPRVIEHRLMQHHRMQIVAAWVLPGVEWAS